MIKKVISPHKDTYVLMYVRTKTSLLGPFRKKNCLDDLIYITTQCESSVTKKLKLAKLDRFIPVRYLRILTIYLYCFCFALS